MLSDSEYKEYLNLLYDLHVLIKEGKGDTEEADIVRDNLDPYWTRASSLQNEVFNEMSVLLYKLDGK